LPSSQLLQLRGRVVEVVVAVVDVVETVVGG
jgi:hypothetical protein